MHIDVLEADIRDGIRTSPGRCPVALALGRALRRPVDVTANYVCLTPLAAGAHQHVSLPPAATAFIQTFDRAGGRVVPFSFELEGAP